MYWSARTGAVIGWCLYDDHPVGLGLDDFEHDGRLWRCRDDDWRGASHWRTK
jgi:hypothetical protein